MLAIGIRWMIHADMEQIYEIENESFVYPWDEHTFHQCLRQRNTIGLSVEHRECVIGFMIYETHKRHFRLTNFAVHPHYRRQGVGTQMIQKLIGKLSQRRPNLVLEVSEMNLPGQLFFRELGFKAIKILHDFYNQPGIDAYQFQFNMYSKQHVKNES